MAGANENFSGEYEETDKSRRYNTSRYPGFTGGSVDPNTGNIIPPTSKQLSGNNPAPPPPAPIEQIDTGPARDQFGHLPEDYEGGYIPSSQIFRRSDDPSADAERYDPEIGGQRHSFVDPIANRDINITRDLDANLFSRVICTELFRTKEIDRDLYLADVQFTNKLSLSTIRGYWWWGVPAVRLMRRNQKFRKFMKAIAIARAEEIGYQVGIRSAPNYKGKLVRAILEPACFVVGLVVEVKDISVIYKEHA